MSGLNPFKRKSSAFQSLAQADVCACRVGASGEILDQSPAGDLLAGVWIGGNEALRAAFEKARSTGIPCEARLSDALGSKFWVVVVPEDEGALLVAHDTTMTDKVTEALLKSRTMLRGLLDNAVDVAFEVDAYQNFIFLTPAEAFGQRTEAWQGRYAPGVFWPQGDIPARNPFTAGAKAQFDAVPVVFEGQEKRWLQFSVEPVQDADGNMLSLRGTCRDVTQRHLAQRQVRQDNVRLALQQRITDLLNTIESSQELLDSASRELLEVLRADAVWAVMKYREGLVPLSVQGECLEVPDMDTIWRDLSIAESGVMKVEQEGHTMLAIRLERGGEGLGMVTVCRNTEESPWSEQEVQLLNAVADVLTAAFGKAELIDKLYRLSAKDELTSLLNRRALTETVNKRLKHQSRTGLSGCLLFIDLDYFKEVNDTLGHHAGDSALRLVADHLQAIIRPCDYAGRYGGDEFVLWLEDMSAANAAIKARLLIDAMPAIRTQIGNPELRLSASIGICQSEPGVDMSFEDLSDRADVALYQVKNSGRGNIAFGARRAAVGE